MSAARKRREPLVRYVSPFGSPAWMTRERAGEYLARDDRRWEWLLDVERETGCRVLSANERQIGAPRMEHVR